MIEQINRNKNLHNIDLKKHKRETDIFTEKMNKIQDEKHEISAELEIVKLENADLNNAINFKKL